MIFRLLKQLGWFFLLTSFLTACVQVSPQTRYNQSSANSINRPTGLRNASASMRILGRSSSSAAPDQDVQVADNSDPTTAVGADSLWSDLRGDFQLSSATTNEPAVQEQINWYVHHQQYLNRVVTRAAPYMYYIFARVKERNLPAELVLLPIMESAYNPFANSCRGATGLWQLMSATACGYGVKEDWWYDGRRDIYASTNAALDYLTYLQSYFGGDWLLAIASYDAGEGTLQSAVHRNAKEGRNTDFWDLQLPAETQSYVPRLLALAAIISNPAKYGITLPAISDQPYLQQVDIGAPINLNEAAQFAGMTLDQLKEFNPGYTHSMTGPTGPYKLLLPIDRIPVFKQNLAAAPSITTTIWGHYQAKHGDTLASIASRYNTTVSELKDANQLKGHKLALAGKMIMVPTGTEVIKPHVTEDTNSPDDFIPPSGSADVVNSTSNSTVADNTNPSTTNTNSASTADNTENNSNNSPAPAPALASNNVPTSTTAVANGNSVTDNNDAATTAAFAAAANQSASSSSVNTSTSQDTSASSSAAAVPQSVQHKVKAGETLSSISRQYKVKVSDLERWNHLKNGRLKPGASLVINSPTANVVATTSSSSTPSSTSTSSAGATSTKTASSHKSHGSASTSHHAKHATVSSKHVAHASSSVHTKHKAHH